MDDPPHSSPASAARVSWSATTDTGRFRQENEDAFLALEMDANEVRRLGKYGEAGFDDGDFIFAVSDGIGGHNAGEFASRIAVEKITELLPAAFRREGANREAPDLLDQLVHRIHAEIQRLGQAYAELSGMGATLSLCWFAPGWMHFCHVGDSRIYRLPEGGGIEQISHDHTHVGWLRRTGQITAIQAKFHPMRGQLSQSLNAKPRNIRPQIGSLACTPGDRFVLCSDGLNDGLSDRNIEHFVRHQVEKHADRSVAEAIVSESVGNSGKDNTTAVVIRLGEAESGKPSGGKSH
jgi:protein phosphatase